ncbi:hypothetical protein [Flavobacterium psychrotolerans]|uniref:Carboxypeptidase-like regulatory domain-containing protein n=1 Tax=Flavobacterium psychrotolerans TaxID=2169410 RepID=A0A2U1JIR4_9FLAO|nr:hypothetical protein [Flavobacterium psychrotolerans]PWA05032.1 hypothetical protein DB895_08335 [Flavobacterium psychrotolerans]
MKKFIVLLFLVFYSKTSSQSAEKSIVLKDIDSNLPIEDATVLIIKTKQILLSNSEGTVSFVLKGASNIQISHSSYLGVILRSTTIKENSTVIYLKSSVHDLDEIILTKKHPQKILKSLVENSIKKLTVPARLKVYSREFFKLNGVCTYYNDGLLNFQIDNRSKNFNSDILVEQNRCYGLIDNDISNELLGYNLNDIMENYYNFKYLNPLLEPDAKKEYEFLIKAYSANENYYLMTVNPIDGAKGLLDDFNIIYDNEKKIIIEVSSDVSASTIAGLKEKTTLGSKNIYKSLFKTIYRFDDTNYYLVSSREEIGFERIDNKKSTDIEVKNYFVTTGFSDQNFSFNENEVFKDKTLFNKKNVILSPYWNVSGLTFTDEEQEIINKIEMNH